MINDRLSEEIEAGAKMVPMFSTSIVTLDGGWEVRRSRWRYPKFRFEFNLMPGITGDDVVEGLVDLFIAAGGTAEVFLFRPWRDDYAIGQTLDPISGTQFQAVKSYSRGGTTRQRKITRLIEDSVTVYVDGIEQVGGFTIDHDTGIITFGASQAGNSITADFQFLVLVRFLDDSLDVVAITGELNQPVDVVLIQVNE